MKQGQSSRTSGLITTPHTVRCQLNRVSIHPHPRPPLAPACRMSRRHAVPRTHPPQRPGGCRPAACGLPHFCACCASAAPARSAVGVFCSRCAWVLVWRGEGRWCAVLQRRVVRPPLCLACLRLARPLIFWEIRFIVDHVVFKTYLFLERTSLIFSSSLPCHCSLRRLSVSSATSARARAALSSAVSRSPSSMRTCGPLFGCILKCSSFL